ncbi:nitrilase-related carbon-nitrogen hydrolase [Conexibacter sp. JD483]|uniref:nitrilase-related carbon-nitrogen hydrolase n=1 Tax=unclassified Conexibacter TaxID=2627773 RepID=UPI002723FF3D|nr:MULTISPECIES: nitrilase-related carbon-nitrogen hydrolase [unclassified Conexibacter]MDO8186207.1 nitrilase-related carbon-nitrogen hydrolase [Conexibacter sp. CPCC 205706]MDO8199726.1 nitrilase-related carbon-nitrogen hydrolase [Conexibacter sp. CPCC 205762]MDR9368182.1 nitrilase-related carbon-nitrogen hydrolase [Conexibacter sp. JD483]
MRVLLAQLEPAPGDLDANAAAVATALAAAPEAELAVFPELFLGGYDVSTAAALALDASADGTPLAAVRAAAARFATAVIVGFAERTADGAVANAVACIERDGSLAGVYRKTHLFGADERAAFRAGDELIVVRLAGRLIGPLNCFDVEFPEPARALARAGAELLVTVAANMEPYGPDHALAARARALDNRLPHVYVNRVGDEAGLHFVGGSAAIAAGGRVVEALGETAATRLVELKRDSGDDEAVNYLEHLRDDLPVQGVSSTSVHGGTR